MIELQSSGLVVVGTWNAVEGPNFTRWHIDEEIFSQESLFNKTPFLVRHVFKNNFKTITGFTAIAAGMQEFRHLSFNKS